MTTGIQQIGQLFLEKRKEKQLSLQDVENATSIRSNYLEAIEAGQIDKFLSSVYFTGFIRQYASFLEIDADALAKEYPEIFSKKDEKHDFAYGIGTLEVRGSMGGGVKLLPQLMYGAGFVVILMVAYFFARLVGVV